MTGPTTNETAAESTIDQLTDPTTLRDRDGVAYREETVVHDEDHVELNEPIDGWAVVGVETDAGERLLAHNECNDVWLAPHARVEPGEDYVSVARREAETILGVTVVVDGVERVRETEFRLEGEEDRRTTACFVLFHASLAEAAQVPDHPDVDRPYASGAGWFAAVPDRVPDGDPGDDLRAFFE